MDAIKSSVELSSLCDLCDLCDKNLYFVAEDMIGYPIYFFTTEITETTKRRKCIYLNLESII